MMRSARDPYAEWKFPPLFVEPPRIEHHSKGIVGGLFDFSQRVAAKLAMFGFINVVKGILSKSRKPLILKTAVIARW
jgi:hypothetical protein